jgi:hypothetical protein
MVMDGTACMKYQGFREGKLLSVAKELQRIGLKPSEVYAIMNLAGAKWRSVQLREGQENETYDESDGRVFSEATSYSMKHTMENAIMLGNLTHTSEGERLMLLSIGVTLNRLFTRGSRTVREWLENGDVESRKIVLSFAIGSCIIVDVRMIDVFFKQLIKFRYGTPFDGDKDISDQILASVERLGNAGYSVLQPISEKED